MPDITPAAPVAQNAGVTQQPAPSALEPAPASAERISTVAAGINFDDPALPLEYGARTMNEIARFADSLLGNVRVKDSGPVGESLSELMLRVKDVDLEGIATKSTGFLQSLPLVGRLFNSVERTVRRFDTVLAQVEGISAKLEEAMFGLLKDIEVLEQLYGHNKDFYEELDAHIRAGEQRLAQARDVELPKLEADAAANPGSMAAQAVRDFAERLNRFERRLHDLKLSRTVTLQTAPQIRMIQSNDQTLAEKIQTSILTTIPIWKNQMVLALSIHGQRKAAQLQKDVADTTNSLLTRNAEMLQQATVATAREAERAVVDVESLKTVHQKLLDTIEETLAIAREGRERRRAAEQDLQTMEQDLRTKLVSLADQKTADSLEAARGEHAPLTSGTSGEAGPAQRD